MGVGVGIDIYFVGYWILLFHYRFSGSALLGDNPDSVFQMVAYYNEGSFETVSCIYGEKADVSEFINAIYGKIFFTHGWLKAGDIGKDNNI